MTTPTSLASIPVHDGIEEWLPAALTDGLSPEERSLFEAHLAGCARCRELFAEENAMNQTIQNAFDTVRPLPGFERRLKAAFRERTGDSFGEHLRIFAKNALRRPAVRVVGAAVCVLTLVVLGGELTQESPPRASFAEPQTVTQLDTTSAVFSLSEPLVAGRTDRKEAIPFTPPVGKAATRTEFLFAQAETTRQTASAPRKADAPAVVAGSSPMTKAKAVTKRNGLSTFGMVRDDTLKRDGASAIYGSDAVGGVVNVPLDHDYQGSRPTSESDAGASALDSGPVSATSATAGNAASPAAPDTLSMLDAPPPAEPSAPPNASTPADTRKLIRNASVELEVASFDPAVDALGAAASQVGGGYVATVDSSRLPNGKRRGVIVIKVLPDKLDAFLARLHDLGEIKSQNISTEDVTKDYFDTDARLRNARRMEDRLLKLLDDAKGKLTEILQVEKELGRVREDIEKMQGQLQLYDSLVRYATVTINLYEKDLKQPATFLLHQTADLSLLTADVEKTYADARRVADDAHAQVENSELVRAEDGRVTATLHLLLAPETADSVIAHLKSLARVENFKLTGEREAENGDSTDTGLDASAKLKRGPVSLSLSIGHDEETHRSVSLTVTSVDPSTAFDKSRAAVLAAGGEIVTSTFDRTHGNHGSGELVVRLPANREAGILDTERALGRNTDLTVHRDDNAAPDADTAPILLTLNFADEQVHRRISLTLIAPDLDAAFDKARGAALGAGGEIADSSFNRTQGSHGSAMLSLLIPGKSEAAVLTTVRGLGRSRDFNVQRDTSPSGDDLENGPVSLTVNFADEEAPAQQTSIAVLCAQVDKRQAEVRKIAADAGAQVRSSAFEQGTDGGETASLVFRLPLRAYAGFISRLESLGDVKDLNVHRQDRPEPSPVRVSAASGNADDTEPAEVSLRLYSQGRLVSDESGLVATLRHTLAQGFGALMWSLRMIGVALAFLAPWAAATLLIVWLAHFAARRKTRSGGASEKDV